MINFEIITEKTDKGSLVWLGGISTIMDYLVPKQVSTYIFDMLFKNAFRW